MGSLYRSEPMTRCQLYLQTDAAYTCVAELGELGLVQFRDLNPDVNAFQRKFVNEVRRCDEMERKLRFLEKEIRKDEIPMLDTGENPDAPQPREMIDLEATFEKLENELREVNTNEEMLKKNFLELTELKHILRKTQTFFDEVHFDPATGTTGGAHVVAVDPDREELLLPTSFEESRPAMKLGFVAGVISREKLPTFERLLWRACRGNVFLKRSDITEPLEDPTTEDQVHKCVFVIFFQGDQLKTRVKKICEGFRATLYPCPETPQERREMAIGVMTRIEDLKTVLGQTKDHRHRVLVAAAKNIRLWFTKVRKIKAIYHTLNFFNIDVTQKCLIAECWCPVADLDKIQLALKRGSDESGATVPSILHRMETAEKPPTFFRTNKFTQGFQNIVDAYGVAGYQEINPTPFTIVTFPFLFAVMFGDTGHGIIMFLFALFLVTREKRLAAMKVQDEIFQTFFGGRYIILLMGLFSIYIGFIYNDIFSRSFKIFPSSWKPNYDKDYVMHFEKLTLDANSSAFSQAPYPFGIDPIWQLADNKLQFLNSFKMKMSIIVGVFHMIFGVILSFMNHRYFRKPLNIICEFVPQILFLVCIFFYLCVMIMYKWTHFGATAHGSYTGPNCAPSLLIGLINMFMFKQQTTADPNVSCSLMTFYGGQAGFEQFLVVIAMLCVPWLFIAKPYMIYRSRKQRQNAPLIYVESALVLVAAVCVPWMLAVKPIVLIIRAKKLAAASVQCDVNTDSAEVINHGDSKTNLASAGGGHDDHENEAMSDLIVLQAIHTIEYCLSCISHTASYLRLWALSLAHAQLSEVLWTMVMHQGFTIVSGYGGCLAIYTVFAAFASLTLVILVIMEGLSAFLHALRLHWVEFNSKFYKGDGYAFTPFSFDIILEDARVAEEKML